MGSTQNSIFPSMSESFTEIIYTTEYSKLSDTEFPFYLQFLGFYYEFRSLDGPIMQPKNENISGFFQQNFKIVFGRIESRLKRGPILEL